MARILYQLEQKDDILVHSPSFSPFSSLSYLQSSSDFEKESTPSSPPAMSRISPAILLVIVILSVIFFISGLLHLLFRFLMKRPSFSFISQSNRYPETSGSRAFQRQLQHLFHLHDSGLDQALIDALPVFHYKDIIGLKEPFDCAVCLSEFSEQDKLRLLPVCSHAFHIQCIDTWLVSNSTCPICRGSLVGSGPPTERIPIPLMNSEEPRGEESSVFSFSSDGENGFPCGKRVIPVRLGKFRSLNGGGGGGGENEGQGEGEISSCKLDTRKCYSMGSFQYVVGDSDLQVALSILSTNFAEGKKITASGGRAKGESLSVSKIWLWSKKNKYPNSSDTCLGALTSTYNNN